MSELRATYRLQLCKELDFAHAASRVPYLARLGISHLYLSPILEAARGSTHGYDVIDHSKISTSLGGEPGFEKLVKAAHEAGLGIILDIVPNHMSIADAANGWWWDVLENGRSSRWAHAFDIDWDPPEARLKNTVLLPVLGDHCHRLIEKGELKVTRDAALFCVAYHEHRFPVAPRSLGVVLELAARGFPSNRLAFIADALVRLPASTALDKPSVERRHRDKNVLRELLRELLEADPKIAAAVDRTLDQINSTPQMLDALLERQNYRLAYWRTAQRDLDYRRFFDINSLLGLRMEDPRVFTEAHALIAELLESGKIDGVRVDHVDGLASPAGYLRSLKRLAPHATIHVEKILAIDEQLPPWPVEGTTGYEFAADLTATFLPQAAEAPLTALATELCGAQEPFAELSVHTRQQVLKELLGSDVSGLANLLLRIGDRLHELRDYSRHDLRAALAALAAVFPVYRTYAEPKEELSAQDAAVLTRALAAAKALEPNLDPALFDFIGALLRFERGGEREAELVRRFQQLTAPAMAKGIEDTAFYRDPRLLALEEVGSDPSRFSSSVEAFHLHNQAALAQWPKRLLATSTHDTKRSEDVRARLVAMAQRPEAFASLARSFFAQTQRHLTNAQPDASMRMVALQTMVGAWPLDVPRLEATLLKSAREAKRFTSWTRPDETYELALKHFCAAALGDADVCAGIDAFVRELGPRARAVSLAWTLLKCTCPGVPDFYQGTELWNFSLVDPDNRRAVNWQPLAQAQQLSQGPALEKDEVGLNKMQVVLRALKLRSELPALFGPGSTYLPLTVLGAGSADVIAFARSAPPDPRVAVVAVARAAKDSWADTRLVLPEGTFRSHLSDDRALAGTVPMSRLFSKLPVALLSC